MFGRLTWDLQGYLLGDTPFGKFLDRQRWNVVRALFVLAFGVALFLSAVMMQEFTNETAIAVAILILLGVVTFGHYELVGAIVIGGLAKILMPSIMYGIAELGLMTVFVDTLLYKGVVEMSIAKIVLVIYLVAITVRFMTGQIQLFKNYTNVRVNRL